MSSFQDGLYRRRRDNSGEKPEDSTGTPSDTEGKPEDTNASGTPPDSLGKPEEKTEIPPVTEGNPEATTGTPPITGWKPEDNGGIPKNPDRNPLSEVSWVGDRDEKVIISTISVLVYSYILSFLVLCIAVDT